MYIVIVFGNDVDTTPTKAYGTWLNFEQARVWAQHTARHAYTIMQVERVAS